MRGINEPQKGGCGSLAFSHDGKDLVTGLYYLIVHIFDLAIGTSVTLVKAGYKSGYYELSTSS